MKNAFLFINLLAVMMLLSLFCSGYNKASDAKNFILVAHRGGVVDKNLSENSLKSLDEAINRGYTHVEIDVRVTKDGHAVCFHDNNLMREVGVDLNISDLTLDELKQFKLRKSQEQIPTFDEYCAKCEGRINVMIDTKSGDMQNIEQYAREIEDALTKYGLIDDALIIINRVPSFNQEKVADWFLGKSRVSWRVNLKKAKILEKTMPDNPGQYYFIFNSPKDFTKEDIQGFHKMGLMIIPSINTSHYKTGDPLQQGLADVKKMLEWGVDGLQIDSCYDSLVFARIK